MLFIRMGKVVRPAEILFGTHIEVVVFHVIEHGIYTGHSRNTDGAGGKSCVTIGIEWAVYLQMGSACKGMSCFNRL